MMKQRRNVVIVFLSLLTLIGWIGVEVWQIYNTSTITKDVEKAMKPLNPEISELTIAALEERVFK